MSCSCTRFTLEEQVINQGIFSKKAEWLLYKKHSRNKSRKGEKIAKYLESIHGTRVVVLVGIVRKIF